MQAIKVAGFGHVRIPFDPVFLGWRLGDQTALPSNIGALDKAMRSAYDAGLGVILDLRLSPADLAAVEADPALEARVVTLWTALTTHYVSVPDQRLVFELYDGPQYLGKGPTWSAFAARLVGAVRSGSLSRVVLVSGDRGGGVDGLDDLSPIRDDPAVAYSFRYFLPYIFTLQGAPWAGPLTTTSISALHNVPYPPTPPGMKAVALDAGAPQDLAVQELQNYQAEGWNPGVHRGWFSKASLWGGRIGAKVLCTDFGVLRNNTLPVHRYNWLTDVRVSLEQYHVGWTVSDYADNFAIAPTRQFEPAARAALGLNN